ncbi:hypothetical protein H6G86_36130 [Nostoc sp. FACHB-133]|nr:hypothetical protein [Nostoc sp. FACHB-133]
MVRQVFLLIRYEPIPAEPGHDAEVDYHYTHQGVQALFIFFDPHIDWQRVSNRDHRTRIDWAEEIRQLFRCRLCPGWKN